MCLNPQTSLDQIKDLFKKYEIFTAHIRWTRQDKMQGNAGKTAFLVRVLRALESSLKSPAEINFYGLDPVSKKLHLHPRTGIKVIMASSGSTFIDVEMLSTPGT